MASNLKNIYYNYKKYGENNSENYNLDHNNNLDSVDLPTGWSFICLDETINYYTECNSKALESIEE
uniref:Uncharacterized protein n=1 Tax=Digenea simplex TaxID=945030 RepID=A0A1Z1MTT1_DIGSM|nr:hypothetical protein [Digenea simplex]ARW69510.1 hypothetical protein [Digenea simplex]